MIHPHTKSYFGMWAHGPVGLLCNTSNSNKVKWYNKIEYVSYGLWASLIKWYHDSGGLVSMKFNTAKLFNFRNESSTRSNLIKGKWTHILWNSCFKPENSYFTLFFPPITSVQGLTQCRIWFYQWNVFSQACSCWWGWGMTKTGFQSENSYFTLFFPPITLVQGSTQYRIWFYQWNVFSQTCSCYWGREMAKTSF